MLCLCAGDYRAGFSGGHGALRGFSHIYIEKELIGDPELDPLLRRFPDAKLVEISHYKDVFNRRRQNREMQQRSQKLILARKRGRLIYPGAPVCQSFGEENFFYSSLVMNCIYDCEYCYLKGMYPSGNLLLFWNLPELFSELRELLREGTVYLCVSYDTDLLALEGLFHLLLRFTDFLREEPGLRIEVRTKSGNRSFFKDFAGRLSKEDRERMIFAFTLSPERIIRSFEKRTGSLRARLESAEEAHACGFPIRLCFDPMIYCAGWEQAYLELLYQVFRTFSPEEIRDVSVGSFRISGAYLKELRRALPRSVIAQFPYENDGGVCHYGRGLGERMENFLLKELGKWIPEERIFRWNPAGSSGKAPGIPNSKENGKEAEIDFRGAFS